MTGYGSRPYSSLALRDYDPLSDSLGMDQSRSYLGGRSLSGGAASSLDGHLGHLRDTAISGGLSTVDPYDDRTRFLASRSRFVGECRAPWQLSAEDFRNNNKKKLNKRLNNFYKAILFVFKKNFNQLYFSISLYKCVCANLFYAC